MVSAIDPTKPIDGVPANKADLRANLLTAKNEIEALQASGGGGGTIPTATATQLATASNAINTTAKTAGKLVWDTTNLQLVAASGSVSTDPWLPIVTSTQITPA